MKNSNQSLNQITEELKRWFDSAGGIARNWIDYENEAKNILFILGDASTRKDEGPKANAVGTPTPPTSSDTLIEILEALKENHLPKPNEQTSKYDFAFTIWDTAVDTCINAIKHYTTAQAPSKISEKVEEKPHELKCVDECNFTPEGYKGFTKQISAYFEVMKEAYPGTNDYVENQLPPPPLIRMDGKWWVQVDNEISVKEEPAIFKKMSLEIMQCLKIGGSFYEAAAQAFNVVRPYLKREFRYEPLIP